MNRVQTITTSNGALITVETNEGSGGIESNLTKTFCTPKERDVLETFILALACAGVTFGPEFGGALETTLDTLAQ